MTGVIPRSVDQSINLSASYALSARMESGSIFYSIGSDRLISACCPGVMSISTGVPKASQMAWIFVLNSSRDRPMA